MGEVTSVVQYIRFQLEQLGATNGAHLFEHVCRHYARSVICPAILPATGPVQDGGDQGRDFESFPSAWAYGEIAFCCSIQRKNRDAKIRKDVGKIVNSGTPVVAVHAFLATDLASSRRHKLENWARVHHGLRLVVHDAQALAEGLATPAEFWIAAELLRVPVEMWPDPRDAQYLEMLANWTRSDLKSTAAYFDLVRSLARHCAYNAHLRGKLPQWHAELRLLMTAADDEGVRMKAAREIVMSAHHARGGDLYGTEDAQDTYFSAIDRLDDHRALTDACSTLAAIGLWTANPSTLPSTPRPVDEWTTTLLTRFDDVMPSESQTGQLILRELRLHLDGSVQDPVRFVGALVEILRGSEDRPLFPIHLVNLRLTHLTTRLAHVSQFQELSDLLDRGLEARHGASAAAQNRSRRAELLLNDGDCLGAIRLLHGAKLSWYASGAVPEVANCLITLGRAYLQLGLAMAAKHSALTAIGVLNQFGDGRHLPQSAEAHALLQGSDLLQGAWLKVMDLGLASIDCALAASAEIQEGMERSAASRAVLGIVLTGARLLGSEAESLLRATVFPYDVVPAFLDAASHWNIVSWDDLIEQGDLADMCDTPFSDSRAVRTLSWNGWGIAWTVTFKNDLVHDRVCEQLVAALQIAIALSGSARDMEVVPQSLDLLVECAGCDQPEVDELPASDDRQSVAAGHASVKILWPARSPSPEEIAAWLLSTTVHVMGCVSTLPVATLLDRFEAAFSRTGPHAYVFFQSMATLDEAHVPRRCWLQRVDGSLPTGTFAGPAAAALEWQSGRSPRYNQQESRDAVIERYELASLSTKLLLPQLLAQATFRAAVRSLRNSGFLDWQVLVGVSVLAANLRYQKKFGEFLPADVEERVLPEIRNWTTTPELDSWPPLDLGEFTEDALRHVINLNMIASLVRYGLRPPRSSHQIEGVRRYLEERFAYFEDDVREHDWFPNC